MLDVKKWMAKVTDKLANLKVGDMPIENYGALTGSGFPDKSIATGTTWRELGNFTLPSGIWIVNVAVQFPTNATGVRMTTLHTVSAAAGTVTRTVRTAAQNGTYTTHLITTFVEGGTYYVNVVQNSGSAQTVTGRYTALKVGESLA